MSVPTPLIAQATVDPIDWVVLSAGLLGGLAIFGLAVFIPTHLLESPLRHARGIRPGEGR